MKSKVNKTKKAIDDSFRKDYESIKRGSRAELSTLGKDYMKAIVDTRAAKKVGVPTMIGGDPGSTGIERYVQQLEVFSGADGFGFVTLNLNDNQNNTTVAGPFNDTGNVWYTTSAYTSTNIPPEGTTILSGVLKTGWTQSPYRSSSSPAKDLQWRPVGCTVKVFPESSFADQNGRIVLIEPANHVKLNEAQIPGASVESAPRARVVRGTQTGSQNEQIVLNWHPKSNSRNGFVSNDLAFKGYDVPVAPTDTYHGVRDGCILFFAKPGTQFHVEICVMYEVKGLFITDLKPRLTNSRDMDLVFNTFRHKNISGYVGKPEHVYESYLGRAWEIAKKTAGFISKHEKEISQTAGTALRAIGGFI